MLGAGPGWIILGALKLLAGSFLAFFALSHGVSREHAAEPAHMYLEAFRYVLSQPELALALTGTFVIVSQLKINVTNAYAGSIAWSNFFSRLTHSHPGRVVWLVFNVLLALLLMEIGIFKALEQTLALYANVAVGWVGALVADLVINKPLGLSPPHIEFKRAHLYDINPVGVGAMLLATVVSHQRVLRRVRADGEGARAVRRAGGRLRRRAADRLGDRRPLLHRAQAERSWQIIGSDPLLHLRTRFEKDDMALVPRLCRPDLLAVLFAGCALPRSVQAACAHRAQVGTLRQAAAAAVAARINTQPGTFVSLMPLSTCLVGLMLAMIYLQTSATAHADCCSCPTLWMVFFGCLIFGVVAGSSCSPAKPARRRGGIRRQTSMLMEEIEAHNRTDAALQRAKEVAESANIAKTRYIIGLRHEIRTPLNSIYGYAQLLERTGLASQPPNAVRVIRRSAEHLSSLIDGLLDISSIEAGRLLLPRPGAASANFWTSSWTCSGCRRRARASISRSSAAAYLPAVVYTDEKRLRQILINLLSNAVKYTADAAAAFIVQYRNQVAEFEVSDTGMGIAAGTWSGSSGPSSAVRCGVAAAYPAPASVSPSPGC